MNVLTVLVFRGTGGVLNENNPHYHREPALVRAGHVGVIGVADKGVIIGFHPTPEAAAALGGERPLLEKLSRHEAVNGRLQDDTAVFKRAAELATEGERTTVYMYAVEVSDEMLAKIRVWYAEGETVLYNFPDRDTGLFAPGEANCAWFWWSNFGVQLPKATGSIEAITIIMEQEMYDTWSGF